MKRLAFLYLVVTSLGLQCAQGESLEFYLYDVQEAEQQTYEWQDLKKTNDVSRPRFVPGFLGKDTERPELILADNSLSMRSGQKSLFGVYPRKRVREQTYPQRSVGLLNGDCTGTLVGPRYVLTAAHCIFNRIDQKFSDSPRFSAGQVKNYEPYDSQKVSHIFMPKEYATKGEVEHDYALLVLDQEVGFQAGWLGLGRMNKRFEKDAYVMGYPSDKNFASVWRSDCPIERVNENEVVHRCDTYAGMSGASFLAYPHERAAWPVVTAIHSYGGRSRNGGRALDGEMTDLLVNWMNIVDLEELESADGFKRFPEEDYLYPKSRKTKLYFKNSCRKTVRLALNYEESSERRKTQGWVYLEPGQRKKVAEISGPEFQFYADTMDFTYQWSERNRNCRFIHGEKGVFCFLSREQKIEEQKEVEEVLDCQKPSLIEVYNYQA